METAYKGKQKSQKGSRPVKEERKSAKNSRPDK